MLNRLEYLCSPNWNSKLKACRCVCGDLCVGKAPFEVEMETEPSKPRNRTKRKERAHQLNQEKQNLADEGFSGDEGEGSPPRTSKEKCRTKPRRQRNNSSHSFEEDVIDGFAIMSFKTLEELEVSGIDQLFVRVGYTLGQSLAILSALLPVGTKTAYQQIVCFVVVVVCALCVCVVVVLYAFCNASVTAGNLRRAVHLLGC